MSGRVGSAVKLFMNVFFSFELPILSKNGNKSEFSYLIVPILVVSMYTLLNIYIYKNYLFIKIIYKNNHVRNKAKDI